MRREAKGGGRQRKKEREKERDREREREERKKERKKADFFFLAAANRGRKLASPPVSPYQYIC